MGEQQIKKRSADKNKEEKPIEANPKVIEKGKQIKEDINKLLDKIDDVLEKNAEEHIKNYIQRGGE